MYVADAQSLGDIGLLMCLLLSTVASLGFWVPQS